MTFPSEFSYEPGRLMRASRLAVEKMGEREYVVQGGKEPWYVDLNVDPPCGCPDLYYRGETVICCKHVLAALLQEREPALLQALGDQLLRNEHNLEELLRESIAIQKAAKERSEAKEQGPQ